MNVGRSVLVPIRYIKKIISRKYDLYQQELYSNLCDIIAKDVLIRVEEFEGLFYVQVSSHLFKRLLMTKEYEKKLVEYSLQYIHPERDAIDVGANIGFYSVLFAKRIKKRTVLSIEPAGHALENLYKNIEINHVKDIVVVFEGVVKNNVGTAELKYIEGKEEYSTIGEMVHQSISREKYKIKTVRATTVDLLVEELSLDPGFMKIDVEGVEDLVFLGASKTIRDKRPVILSELYDPMLVANGSSVKKIVSRMRGQGYVALNPETGHMIDGPFGIKNVMFIPNERYKKQVSNTAR